jgi:hypothetical protein
MANGTICVDYLAFTSEQQISSMIIYAIPV